MTRANAQNLIVARDLIGVAVASASGKRLGHVIDLEIDPSDGYRVLGVELGRFGWLDRLHVLRPVAHGKSSSRPRVIPWDDVDRLDGRKLILKAGVSAAREGT